MSSLLENAEFPPCDVLRKVLTERRVLLPGGEAKELKAGISAAHAVALYNTVLQEQPEVVIETGMALGVSTLSMLCALSQTGGKLISIDPYENWQSARDAALYSIDQAGFSGHHTHVEEMSYIALPRLFAEGTQIGFGYIDGDHSFEGAFLDFSYMNRMLKSEGVIGFNDVGWASVERVVNLARSDHEYQDVDVGLPADYRGKNIFTSTARRVLRKSRQDVYLRKSG